MTSDLNRKLFFLDTCLAEVQDIHGDEMSEELKEKTKNMRKVIDGELDGDYKND